jgi:TonB family protein
MHEHTGWLRVAAVTASVGLHVGAYGAMGMARAASSGAHGPTQVDFTVVSASPLPRGATEPPAPPPLERAEPEPAKRAPEPPAPQPAAADPAQPEPAEAEPVDLTGVTLTNEGAGPGWTTVVGDGSRMQGPLGRIRQLREPASSAGPGAGRRRPRGVGRAAAKPAEPAAVPVSDLSRPPRPPPLSGVLLEHYPPEARRRGTAGQAVVSARVDADGRVRTARVVSETGSGFGAACKNTVLGSVWTPPLDRNGQPVATLISYTCRFQVNR